MLILWPIQHFFEDIVIKFKMASIGSDQRQDSPMVDEMLDGAQMDVTDSEVELGF